MNVVDVVTVDVCKKNALKNAQSEVSPLMTPNCTNGKNYQICPFAISLYGRLGKTALNFIDDFENLVKKRMNKRFDRRLWLNRIVFTIFKSIPKMISKALMSVSAHYENIAAVSSAVLNQDLHSLLLEKGVCENKASDSSLFVTIVPRRFGLCATNEAFVTKMRLYLNIPINQLLSKEKCICSNSPQLTLRHALNCSKLITYRSSLHDAVRDTVFNMAQTARISCIKESLLKETLSLNNFWF
ncbi:hypothetical protein P9112_000051 [Eukaryota sp. TZLM1-RC]